MFRKYSQMQNNNSLKILGIDPGYGRIGLAVIEKTFKGKETILYSSCLETPSKDSIYSRFKNLGAEIERVLEKYSPDEVALETLFIAKNQKTGMRVAEARGIIIYEAVKRGLPVFEYSPLQIKSAITGDGTSDKGRMIKMIGLLVDLPKKYSSTDKVTKEIKVMLDDEYDAIAVALTHSARRQSLK